MCSLAIVERMMNALIFLLRLDSWNTSNYNWQITAFLDRMATAAPLSSSTPAPNFPNPPTCSLWGPAKADPDIAGTGVRTMVMIRCVLSANDRFTGSHRLYALCLSHSIPRHRTLPVRRPSYAKSN